MATNKIVREDALSKLATLQKGYIDSKVAAAVEATTLTGKDAIVIDEKVVSLKIAEGNKVLSQSTAGLTTTLKLAYVKKTTDASAKVQLQGIGNEVISEFDASDFVMDGMLSDVKLEGNNLVFTFNTDAGEHSIVPVDLSKYIDTYTAGNGIAITGRAVSAKVNEEATEKYLKVTEDGLEVTGVDAKIASEVGKVTAAMGELSAEDIEYGEGTVEDALDEVKESINTINNTTINSKITAALDALDLETVGSNTEYVKWVKQENGKVTAEAATLNATAVAATSVGDGTATTVQGILGELNASIKKVSDTVGSNLDYMSEEEAEELYESIYE